MEAGAAPLVVDVRKNEAFLASGYTLSGALRRDPFDVATWAAALPAAPSVVVYCVHGHEISKNTHLALRAQGIPAHYLEGGIEGWRTYGGATVVKPTDSPTRWVTRERPKIDRIACPWLLRRFVDAHAQFLYVPAAQVRTWAAAKNATPYDVNAEVATTLFTHEGARCSFDAFIHIYRLGADAALLKLADIVRGADTDQLQLAPQAAGLLALSLGMSRLHPQDDQMLGAMLPIYDALYAWCRDSAKCPAETHNWAPA